MAELTRGSGRWYQEFNGEPVILGAWTRGIHKLDHAEDNYFGNRYYYAKCGQLHWSYQYVDSSTYRRKPCKKCWPRGIPQRLHYKGPNRWYILNIHTNIQHIEHGEPGNRGNLYCGLLIPAHERKASRKPWPNARICGNCQQDTPRRVWRKLVQASE